MSVLITHVQQRSRNYSVTEADKVYVGAYKRRKCSRFTEGITISVKPKYLFLNIRKRYRYIAFIPKLRTIFIHLFISEKKDVVTSESSNIDFKDSINVEQQSHILHQSNLFFSYQDEGLYIKAADKSFRNQIKSSGFVPS
jgi:hypothetical protein